MTTMSKVRARASLGLQTKVTLVFSAISMCAALLVAAVGFQVVRGELEQQLRGKLLSAVTLGARLFSGSDIASLSSQVSLDLDAATAEAVLNTEEFQVVSTRLNQIRSADPDIMRFVYLLATDSTGRGFYLADADVLKGGEGPLSLPGTPFSFESYPVARQALAQKSPQLEDAFIEDTEFLVRSLSGYAPVFDSSGNALAILGVDMVDSDVSEALSRATQWIVGVGLTALVAALLISMLMARVITRNLIALQLVVEKFGQKDYAARAQVRSRDEIGALARSFNAMAQTLVDDQNALASAEREAARNAESRKYLENISQGLLFTDSRWVVGSQVSRHLLTMFQLNAAPEGRSLVDVVFPDAEAHRQERERLAAYLDKLGQSSAVERAALEAENPLRNRVLRLSSGTTVVVDARFLLLETDGKLSDVMVIFDDKTQQAQAERVLEDERSVHEAEMEFLLALVKHGPHDLEALIVDLEGLVAGSHQAPGLPRNLVELRSRATALDLFGLSRDLWQVEADPAPQQWDLLNAHVLQTKSFVDKATASGTPSGVDSARTDFETEWSRLTEEARKWAEDESKQVRLIPRVDETCVQAVNDLREVISHLVKNAITHGVETPSVRASKGKSPEGQVMVEAKVEAGQITIGVSDDGTGLDAGRLRRLLEARGGSFAPKALDAKTSAQQVVEALFDPQNRLGLGQTAEVLRRFKGNLSVKSQRDRGATFVIRLAQS